MFGKDQSCPYKLRIKTVYVWPIPKLSLLTPKKDSLCLINTKADLILNALKLHSWKIVRESAFKFITALFKTKKGK